GGILAGDLVELDQARAGVLTGSRLVEPDVAAPADAKQHEVEPACVYNRLFILPTVLFHFAPGNVALRYVDVLRAHVYVVKEVFPHEPVVALDAVGFDRVVLVEVERDDGREVELAVLV